MFHSHFFFSSKSQISPCFVAAQSLHHVQRFVTQWIAAHQGSISFTIFQSLLKLMSIELMMLANQLIICHLLLLLPSIFPSIRCFPVSRLFALGGQSIGASASVSVLPLNVQDWFSLGLVGLIFMLSKRLKSLPQHHSSKVVIHWYLGLFMVQLSHLYMTTGKTIALTTWTFVSKVMSLFSNMLSTFVMGFPDVSDGKESAHNAGDLGLISGLGRSPGGGHGNLPMYSAWGTPHGQRGLEGCSPCGHKESDMTEWLNWTEPNWGNHKERGECVGILYFPLSFSINLELL